MEQQLQLSTGENVVMTDSSSCLTEKQTDIGTRVIFVNENENFQKEKNNELVNERKLKRQNNKN